MGTFLVQRRRHLMRKGRLMTLRRSGQSEISLLGFSATFSPDQITGAIKQGDRRVSTLNDEIAAAAWPSPPRNTDFLFMDGKTWSIQGVDPKYEGADCIGYEFWIRGGAA